MNRFAIYEIKSHIVKALANPLRLAICEYLLSVDEAKCVNHIAKHFEQNQSTISKHLSILQKEGIVELKKCGNFIRYTIKNRHAVECFVEAVNTLLENKVKMHQEALNSLKK